MPEAEVIQPEGWTVEPLSKCVDVLDSRRKPVNSVERATRQGDVPYYGATGQVGWIDDHLFDEELVLVGEDGAPFLDKSKPIAYLISGKSWVNNHAHVLRARDEVTSNRYIKHYLDAFDFTHRVQGSTRDKLTQGSMNTIPVILAPRSEQDSLVSLIEAMDARRGSATRHLTSARTAIERLRQAVLAEACSGKLIDAQPDFDFDSFNQVVVTERRSLPKRLQQPAGLASLDDLPEIPAHWRWMSLDQLIDGPIQNGLYLPGSRYGTGVPILRIEDFQLHSSRPRDELKRVSATPDEEVRFALREGDLVINRVNSPSHLGKSLSIESDLLPAVFESNMMRVRLRKPMNSRYLNLFLTSLRGRRLLTRNAKWAVNQASINQTDVRECPIPVPPPDEQDAIVRRVEEVFQLTGRLGLRVDAAARRVDRSSQAVLDKAFRGELVPGSEGRG